MKVYCPCGEETFDDEATPPKRSSRVRGRRKGGGCLTVGCMARPSKDLLDRFSLLETSELALAQQATSRFWPAHESESIGPEVYSLVMNRALLGDIALTFVRCSARIRVKFLEAVQEPALLMPLEGSIEITADSGTYRAIPGHPLFHAAGWFQRFEAAPCRCLIVNLPTASLPHPNPGFEPPPFSSHMPLAGESADLLRGQILTLFRAVNASERVKMLQERAPHERVQLLSKKLRSREQLFLQTLAVALTGAAKPRQVEDGADVEAWLAQHALSRVPLAELARRAGRSMRSLQRACAKLGYTPQTYLHSVRLDRAREMLLAPGEMLTVAEVAETVGYPHLGRFAGYYAERFGELPSDTLTRGRRSKEIVTTVLREPR